MSIQNAINGQPQAVLRQEVVATAGVTDLVTVNSLYAAFVLELSGIETTASGRHLRLQLFDSTPTLLDAMQYSVNYFANEAATTFTNISASSGTVVRLGPNLDDAGGTADIQLQMFSFSVTNRSPAWQGSFTQTFAGPPITGIAGFVSGVRQNAGARPATIQVSLDDGTSTFGGVVRVYELIGA